jgi:hypothetical protein
MEIGSVFRDKFSGKITEIVNSRIGVSPKDQKFLNALRRIKQAIETSAAGGGGGGIPDAPKDGKAYNRRNGDWAETPEAGEFPDPNTLALRDDDGRINTEDAVDAKHAVNYAQMQSAAGALDEAIAAEASEREDADAAKADKMPAQPDIIFGSVPFEVPAGRVLAANTGKTPVMSPDSAGDLTAFVSYNVAGGAHKFGAWTNDGGLTTHFGHFDYDPSLPAVIPVQDWYDGTVWLSDNYLVKQGIDGRNIEEIGMLSGLDIGQGGDISVLPQREANLADVRDEMINGLSELSLNRLTRAEFKSQAVKRRDIIDSLESQDAGKPLSARQGALLEAEIADALADAKEYTDQQIKDVEEHSGTFIGVAFQTKADLDAYTIPDRVGPGDFTFVQTDETHGGATTRYICEIDPNTQEKVWGYAYTLDQNFSAAQMAAINSGITAAGLAQILAAISGGADAIAEEAAARSQADDDTLQSASQTAAGYVDSHEQDPSAHGDIRSKIGDDIDAHNGNANAHNDLLALYAKLASPEFTGSPKTPLASFFGGGTSVAGKKEIANLEYVERAKGYVIKHHNTGIGVDIKLDAAAYGGGTQVLFDIWYNETASGALVAEARIHGQFYTNESAIDSRHGMVQNTNRPIDVYAYHDENHVNHIWIPKIGANDFPALRVEAYRRTGSDGLPMAPALIAQSVLSAAPSGMVKISDKSPSGGGTPSTPVTPATTEWRDTGRLNWDGKKIWTRAYDYLHPVYDIHEPTVDAVVSTYPGPTNINEIVKLGGSWGFGSEFDWGGVRTYTLPMGYYLEFLEGINSSSGIPMRRLIGTAGLGIEDNSGGYNPTHLFQIHLQIGDTQAYHVKGLWCKCYVEVTTNNDLIPDAL